MADWGMRVSKEGFDVKTCADEDLVMSSSINLLKTAQVGTISGGTQYFINHNLGFTPIFFSIGYDGTVGSFMGMGANNNVYVDGTAVYSLGIFETGGPIKYYLFYEDF